MTDGLAEASVGVFGISMENACELGIRYRQNAIIWVGEDATPQLVLLR
jgi:hypothetical protein